MIYFLTILTIAFIILTILFSSMTSNMIYRTTIEDLTSYGNAMIEEIMEELSSFGNLNRAFHKFDDWLSPRNIRYEILNRSMPLVDDDIHMDLPPIVEDGDDFNIHITKEEYEQFIEGGIISGVSTTINNETICFVMMPKILQNSFMFGVSLYSPVSGLEQTKAEILRNLVTAFLVSLAAAFILIYIFTKIQVQQFKKMSEATRQIQMGNYDIQINNKSNDEIGELANDFNAMAYTLKHSREEIERQERRRRQLISDVSHELRTPLTTINGILEGIVYNMIPISKKEDSIKLMQEETQRLIRLVNENLDYDKLRSNQISLHKVQVNVLKAFTTVKQQLNNSAVAKGNAIVLEADDQLTAYADYDRLIQILVNLGQNAIQFTENGTITFSAYKKYNSVHIDIADTGIGMKKEEMEKIWDRFYKADTSRKNMPYGESGLGLAIVKQLVSMHGGTIEVNSKIQEGTTMTVILPFK